MFPNVLALLFILKLVKRSKFYAPGFFSCNVSEDIWYSLQMCFVMQTIAWYTVDLNMLRQKDKIDGLITQFTLWKMKIKSNWTGAAFTSLK